MITSAAVLFSGCASVQLEDPAKSEQAKAFAAPSPGKAGLYVYRSTGVGTAVKRDLWVNGECLGRSAQNVFFYTEIPGDATHTVATESEFSPNQITVDTQAGENVFVQQYIKMGLFVAGANVKQVDAAEGMASIAKLDLAVPGQCKKPTP